MPRQGKVHWLLTGLTIEEGANWIHGVEKNNNPLLALAEATQLKLIHMQDTFSARNFRGECVRSLLAFSDYLQLNILVKLL